MEFGFKFSEESKKKMSDSHKGKIPWNKGRKNPYSKEVLEKMSKSQKDRLSNPDNHPMYKKHHTEESKKKISEKTKGNIPWNKNLKNYNPGEKNGMWKGELASYSAIHKWVQSHKPKSIGCEQCGKQNCRLELANLSGKYKRDINDYKYMCVKCHRTYDDTLPLKFKTPKKDIKELDYSGMHRRLRKQHPHNYICGHCGENTYDLHLANISGKYLLDIKDYIYLCRECHIKFDKSI
jgi:hypothetical protein